MAPRFQVHSGIVKKALLSDLLGGDNSNSGDTNDNNNGIIGSLTSGLGEITSAIGGVIPTLSTTSTTSTTSSSSTSSSSSSSSTSSSDSTSTTSSTSSSTSTSASTAVSTLPTSESSSSSSQLSSQDEVTSTPTPPPTNIDPSTVTATATAPLDDTTSSVSSTATSTPKGFLQNKPAMGVVFGLAGLAALILVIMSLTWFVRRKRRDRLERAAEKFGDSDPSSVFPDPGSAGGFSGASSEKLIRTNTVHTARTGGGGGSDEALISPIRQTPYTFTRPANFQGAVNNNMAPLRAPQPTNGFTPLPAPPGARGPSPSQQAAMGYGPANGAAAGSYVYESPYAPRGQQMTGPYPTFTAPQTHRPPPLQLAPARSASNAVRPGQHQPRQGSQGSVGSGSSASNLRPASSTFGAGNGIARPDSITSDAAYADYAFASGPRNLTIANV